MFHMTANREKRPNFRFFAYFSPIYPSIFKGLFLSMIVLCIPLSLCSIIMAGSFWDYPLKLGKCLNDEYCIASIFDYINPVIFY